MKETTKKLEKDTHMNENKLKIYTMFLDKKI